MDQIIKISSEQSGQFTETNNIVRFQISADGQYDLVDSYIAIMTEQSYLLELQVKQLIV